MKDSFSKYLLLTLVLFQPWTFVPLPAQNNIVDTGLAGRLAITSDPYERIEVLLQLSKSLKDNQPDKAKEYAIEADRLAGQHSFELQGLEAKVLLADIFWGMSDFRKSMEYAMVSLDLAEKNNALAIQAEANRILGKIYTDLGDYRQSSDYYFESLKLTESLDDMVATGRALNSIGYLYFEQNDYEKSLEYYEKSLQIARQINDKMGISRGLNNVAAVHANLKEFEVVEDYIREAVKINTEIGQRLWTGVNYLNLGVIYQDQNIYDTALIYHKKAEHIFSDLRNLPKLGASYLNLSDYYQDTGEKDSSFIYAKKALNLGQDHQLKKVVLEAAVKLHNYYKSDNVLDSAYKYGMLQYAMKDSLDLEESLTRLSKLELQYDFDKQAQDKKLLQQRRDFITVIIIILLISIILLVLLALGKQRANTRSAILARQKLEDEVEFKSKELTINVMNLITKNELLTEISNKLIDIQGSAVKDETKAAILQIARDIKRSTEHEVWEEFELRFKQVHGEFYDKLLSQFPDLTPNEQKLCAFLRLNLSSKEISEMTGQRVSTIEMARHRLRKKLGISNTQTNLVTFLSQI